MSSRYPEKTCECCGQLFVAVKLPNVVRCARCRMACRALAAGCRLTGKPRARTLRDMRAEGVEASAQAFGVRE